MESYCRRNAAQPGTELTTSNTVEYYPADLVRTSVESFGRSWKQSSLQLIETENSLKNSRRVKYKKMSENLVKLCSRLWILLELLHCWWKTANIQSYFSQILSVSCQWNSIGGLLYSSIDSGNRFGTFNCEWKKQHIATVLKTVRGKQGQKESKRRRGAMKKYVSRRNMARISSR